MMCNTVWFFSESQCAGVATGIELPDGPQHASPRNYSYGFTVKSCSTVWFFPGLKCAGTPKGVPRPATVSNASSSLSFVSVLAEPMRSAASIACSYDRNPCAVVPCPANTPCTSYGNTAHACPCSSGFTRVNGNCVDKCTARKCPANSSCYLRGGAAECVCRRGFIQQSNGSCAPQPIHDEWLGSQNDARASVGSPLLVWNDTLAAAARAWGSKLTSTSCYNTSLEKGVPYGQNTLAASGFAPRDTVNVWMSGRLSYTRAEFPNGCKNGQLRDCIHFLKAVWNTTKSVGCAVVPCKEEWSTYICNYYPMGGIVGSCPF
ncbi:unnamed protein product [Closterium sp. NIES-65]|nr:unnamed protein product [Closterium sp. NIES-65]